jgi:protocatechuate 3,4-dioxygenase beta subunit
MLTRREALLRCAALGSLNLVVPGLGAAEAVAAFTQAEQAKSARKATQWNEIGPFYKRLAPNSGRLRAPSDPGLGLAVSGRVFNTRGEALTGAKVEIWQADHHGLYDLDGYRYRAALVADASGLYQFESVMPGHYPARVCQHIHYAITAEGHKPLITQLYFATDPVFEGDPDKNYAKDPLVISRELVRPVTLTGDPKTIQAAVTFDIVMERL